MVVLFVLYLGYQRFSVSQGNQTLQTTLPQEITIDSATTTGIYKDGTYIGTRADAYYGFIEVQAIVKNGRLSDVQFLDHPSDQRESIQINSQAMPALRSEAIAAQSANVAIVSRATDSSLAFRQSLAAALAQAKS